MDWYVDDRRPLGVTEEDLTRALPPGAQAGSTVEAVAHLGSERLNTPLEWARAPQTDGWTDGCLPITAWEAGITGLAMGRLTPLHGVVGSDQITAVPAAELNLDAETSRALFEAVRPLFTSEGVDLTWREPLVWEVAHESLATLPTSSLARVEGDALHRWQARSPLADARLLRRLQNEAQMVLHAHALNQARAEQGQLPVNTLWLSGTGIAAEPHPQWLQQVVEPLGPDSSVAGAEAVWNAWAPQATPACRLYWATAAGVMILRTAAPVARGGGLGQRVRELMRPLVRRLLPRNRWSTSGPGGRAR